MLEQLAGPQVHDAVAAVEQVRVARRVGPGVIAISGSVAASVQRALDARAGLGPLGRPEHVLVGLVRDQALCGPSRAISFIQRCTWPSASGSQLRPVPDQPAVPRHDVPELLAVDLSTRRRAIAEFGQRLGVPPAADLDHGGERAAPLRLRLIGRMRPHLRRLGPPWLPGLRRPGTPVIASRGSGCWRGPRLAAVPGPAELAGRGLIVPAMVQQRPGGEPRVWRLRLEWRGGGREDVEPVRAVVAVPDGGRVTLASALARAGHIKGPPGLVVEFPAVRAEDVGEPVGTFIEVVPRSAAGLGAGPGRGLLRRHCGHAQRHEPRLREGREVGHLGD